MKKAAITILMLSLFTAVLPLLSMLIAGFLANILGCTLNEADFSVCPSAFGDIGGLLSLMALFGWLIFYTIPLGFAGILLSVVFFIIHVLMKKKAPRV